jgi:hypothetical protein
VANYVFSSECSIIALRMSKKDWNVVLINILMNIQVPLKEEKFID